MTPEDIRIRLAELDSTPAVPVFETCLIRAVLAAIDGDNEGLRFNLFMADLIATGRQWLISREVRRAIEGSQEARIEVWVNGPGFMSPAGHSLLMAALLLHAGPPGGDSVR